MDYTTIRLEISGPVARLFLTRPDLRNAINASMIRELRECLGHLVANPPRVLVLSGDGSVFCAGADANWMAETGRLGWDENYVDALAMADLLAELNSLPCPVLARVQGGAYGGGIGLICCCDAVVCADNAQFSLSEVRLGLTPSTISPYVLAKIGASHARDLFLSAARFGAQRAQASGMVHEVVAETELDSAVEQRIQQYLACAPGAMAAAKAQIASLGQSPAQWREETARLIAELRSSSEGREGLAAFLEKRKPEWAL